MDILNNNLYSKTDEYAYAQEKEKFILRNISTLSDKLEIILEKQGITLDPQIKNLIDYLSYDETVAIFAKLLGLFILIYVSYNYINYQTIQRYIENAIFMMQEWLYLVIKNSGELLKYYTKKTVKYILHNTITTIIPFILRSLTGFTGALLGGAYESLTGLELNERIADASSAGIIIASSLTAVNQGATPVKVIGNTVYMLGSYIAIFIYTFGISIQHRYNL